MRARALLLAASLAWSVVEARSAPARPGAFAAAPATVAARDRIQLPGGSQILLRREYRAIFRTPMRWSEGMVLERVYVAERAAVRERTA